MRGVRSPKRTFFCMHRLFWSLRRRSTVVPQTRQQRRIQCACSPLFTHISCKHRCPKIQPMCPCAYAIIFAHICCRHRCLQTQPVCPQHFIYAHLLQALMPASSAHAPAVYYLRTSVTGIDACKFSPCACKWGGAGTLVQFAGTRAWNELTCTPSRETADIQCCMRELLAHPTPEPVIIL